MIRLGKEENINFVLGQSRVVILQFGTAACAPCTAIKDRLDRWSKDHNMVETRYISLEDFPELAATFGIFSAPTVLVFVEGQLTIRESGYFSLDGILKRTERYINLLD